ncbi:MAG: copper amine oxidase N-terminal domain-containing protein [Clostridiales bacterium]|nr:copper amine oxidase N-terminal domain-containing protein [Clostridiales bacterium]
MRKIKKAFLTVALFAVICGTIPAEICLAVEVYGSHQLSLSMGRFAGVSAEYYFYVPPSFREYIFAGKLDESVAGEIEQIRLYCSSASKKYKPALLFSLYVFEIDDWSNSLPYKLIVKTSKYAFAVDYSEVKGFTNPDDNPIFRQIYSRVDTADEIYKLLEISDNKPVPSSDTIYINGIALKKPPKKIDGLYYVPLRDVCESFGIRILCRADDRTVQVSQDDFYDSFKIYPNTTSDKRGIKMRIINDSTGDRTYVHTAYITQILKKNVEIGEGGNIYIYK